MKKKKIESKWVQFLVVVVIGILIVVVISINKKQNPLTTKLNNKPTPNNEVTQVATVAQEPVYTFDDTTEKLTSPELLGHKSNELESFIFQLKIPQKWKVYKNEYSGNKTSYTISLSKDDLYFIDINYGIEYGPSRCVFPGEKKPDGGYEDIDQYSEINSGIGILRIARNNINLYKPDSVIFRICQLNKYNEWSTATKIDLVTIRAPYKYEQNIIQEAENIIKSLAIQQL